MFHHPLKAPEQARDIWNFFHQRRWGRSSGKWDLSWWSLTAWECRGMCLPSLTLAGSFLVHLGCAMFCRLSSASSIQGTLPVEFPGKPMAAQQLRGRAQCSAHSSVCWTKLFGCWVHDQVCEGKMKFPIRVWSERFNKNIYTCTSFKLCEEHHALFICWLNNCNRLYLLQRGFTRDSNQ